MNRQVGEEKLNNGECSFDNDSDNMELPKQLGIFRDCSKTIQNQSTIVATYDNVSLNYHMVPRYDENNSSVNKYLKDVTDLIKNIKSCLSERKIALKGGPNSKNTKLHQYRYVVFGEWEYLLSFNRLWVENERVNNNMGEIQFMKYSKIMDGPNYVSEGKSIIMYPSSAEDGNLIKNKKSTVYNPIGLNVESNAKDIADAFIRFIENEQTSCIYEG